MRVFLCAVRVFLCAVKASVCAVRVFICAVSILFVLWAIWFWCEVFVIGVINSFVLWVICSCCNSCGPPYPRFYSNSHGSQSPIRILRVSHRILKFVSDIASTNLKRSNRSDFWIRLCFLLFIPYIFDSRWITPVSKNLWTVQNFCLISNFHFTRWPQMALWAINFVHSSLRNHAMTWHERKRIGHTNCIV